MSDKTLISVRVSDDGLNALNQMAEEEGIDRSELIRTLLREAVTARLAKRKPEAVQAFLKAAAKRNRAALRRLG